MNPLIDLSKQRRIEEKNRIPICLCLKHYFQQHRFGVKGEAC